MTDEQAAAEQDERARHDVTDWESYYPVDQPDAYLPHAVARWLLENEYPIIATRQHPARLLAPAAVLLAGIAAGILANLAELKAHHATGPVVHNTWAIIVLAALAWSVWRWQDWRATWIIITPRRVLSVYGILNRTCEQLPVSKLRDADLTQDLWGRLLGYATFEFSSIATGSSLQEVRFVPMPVETHREITRLITRG